MPTDPWIDRLQEIRLDLVATRETGRDREGERRGDRPATCH